MTEREGVSAGVKGDKMKLEGIRIPWLETPEGDLQVGPKHWQILPLPEKYDLQYTSEIAPGTKILLFQ